MREGAIILPRVANDGTPLNDVEDLLVNRMSLAFGGVTIIDGIGAWNGPQGIEKEPIRYYISGYDPSPENNHTLRAIAIEAGRLAGQLAVYYRTADGQTHVIDLTSEVMAA